MTDIEAVARWPDLRRWSIASDCINSQTYGDLVWPKVQEVSEVQVALLLWVPGGQEQTGRWPTTLQTPSVMGHTVLEPGQGEGGGGRGD